MTRTRAMLLFGMATCFVAAAAMAQGKPAKPAKPPAAKPPVTAGAKPPSGRPDSGAPVSVRELPNKGAVDGGAVEVKQIGDGGARAVKFGDVVEIEGRLKSPQLVYFLRRVRAEFAAGDLGHRSFMQELSQTRNGSAF
jgi:hypothetical protein